MKKIIKIITIVVIVFIVIILLIPATIGFLGALNPRGAIEKAEEKSNEQLLARVEDDNYFFYYPNYYTEGNPQNLEVYFYENSNTSAVEKENISLKIERVQQKPSYPTYEFCMKFAETFRTKEEDVIKTEVVSGGLGDGKGAGCKVTANMPIDGINDSVVIVEKSLWDQNSNDNNIYRMAAIYYSNASKDEAQILGMAVDSLTLK